MYTKYLLCQLYQLQVPAAHINLAASECHHVETAHYRMCTVLTGLKRYSAQPPQGRGYHKRELISLHAYSLDARKKASFSATMTSTSHSHCCELPVLCTCCQQHSICDHIPLHSLFNAASPLSLRGCVTVQGLTQDICHITKLSEVDLHFKRIGWDRMLLIPNIFQYPSICNKRASSFILLSLMITHIHQQYYPACGR